MMARRQRHQAGKLQRGNHLHEKRWIITITIIFFLLIVIAIVWILNSQSVITGSWSAILSTIITILGIIVAICQWLFPVSSSFPEPSTPIPPTPSLPEIHIHVPVTQPLQSTPVDTTVHGSIHMQPLSSVPKSNNQNNTALSGNEDSKADTIRVPKHPVFLFNEPLTDSNEFFGRMRERKTLINRIKGGASTSIIGPRRIGKTWLLQYVKLVALTEFGPHVRIAELVVSPAGCATVADFTSHVLEEFKVTVPLLSQHPDLGLSTLNRVVRDMKSRGQVPILCIDEFEGFKNFQQFDLDFFTGLRAIAHEGLVLVIASRKPLIDIVADVFGEQSRTSPFFNIFEQLKLKPFSAIEAGQFLEDKGTQANFTDQERMRLLQYGQQLGEYWPLCLQLAGKMLLEDKILAATGDHDHYRPNDENYWWEFERELEEKYRAVVRP